MKPLNSSNLLGYDYDPDAQGLTIYFQSGRSYRYSMVPQSIADGLESASSPGQYFNSNIKNIFQTG